jgi:UDP:flavonoid glycosyltransferase YjiC (YdhE family)
VRILLATFGSFGDLNPYLGLARALRARGHDPAIATSSFYRRFVEGAGIRFHAVRPDVDLGDRAELARIMDPTRGTEHLLRNLIAPHIRDSYADLTAAAEGADFVVSHPITFAAPMVAARRGLRWASSVLAPISFFSAYDIPVPPAAPWLKAIDRLGPRAGRAFVALARRMSAGWIEPVRRFRAELGLPDTGDPLYEGQHAPALVLGLFPSVLGPRQPDWPAATCVTGAIFDDAVYGRALDADLDRFIGSGPAPIVFVLGSAAVGAAGSFFAESARAATALGRRAVLVTGHHPENRVGALTRDVYSVDAAPYSALFPRAAAIVHQGGIGTTNEALRAGRPTVVVPFSHDQPDNAFRVERLGVSCTLGAARYRADRVAHALESLLADPGRSRRAESIAAAVRQERGADAACDAIEAVALARR